MTDKELRKLSRLEILEILLEETKENERLKAELDEIKNQETTQGVETDLSQAAEQMKRALSDASRLVSDLEKIAREGITVKAVTDKSATGESIAMQSYPTPPKKDIPVMDENTKNIIISDRNLYWRMMHFYARNEMALAFLPPDIQNDVRTRLRGISDARK